MMATELAEVCTSDAVAETRPVVKSLAPLSRQRSVKFSKSTDDIPSGVARDRYFAEVPDDDKSGEASRRFRVAKVRAGEDKNDNEESFTYETQATFGRNTLESLPHLDHYRDLLLPGVAARKRPTLNELHEQEPQDELDQVWDDEDYSTPGAMADETKLQPAAGPKLGWIQGVLIRCLLNIFGVMLFLRLSWVVGQAGILLATVIILLSSLVTILTALSMSAICTNGEVKGGGAYYMISRCLGPEFGGAIGIIFSLANAVAAAMYIVGFAETIRDILLEHGRLMVDEVNDVRIIGAITSVGILLIALAGLSWESKAQLFLLIILAVAIVNFMIGTFIPTSEEQQEKGFMGYTGTIFVQNLTPDFRKGHSFFSVFAIFFPAATGILAGANISGDLKDGQRAIPKGTILAIIITTIIYLAMAWMVGICVLRDAGTIAISTVADTTIGSIGAVLGGAINSNNMTSLVLDDVGYYGNDTESVANATVRREPCVPGVDCKYGIQNDMQVMQLVSVFGPFTVAGIVSATLSSALASIVSGPRVFQAVCKDNIFPHMGFFAKGYGVGEEPRRGYLLAFIIGLACVGIGDLNLIAPLISNFFLMSYALINYSCVDASLAKSPGWRPSFRYYSMWLSLLGALLCVFVMFVINWSTALVTIALVTALYFYVHYRKPDVNWGSSTQAHVYRSSLQHTQKLTRILEHVKNFRPQVLAMTGFPGDRPALVDFVGSLTKNISLMVCAQVLLGDPLEKLRDPQLLTHMAYGWLNKRKAKSFFTPVTASSLRRGIQAIMQCSGVGKLRPNTLMLGFKSDWRKAPPENVMEYVNIIHDAFDLLYGVGILCLKERLYNPTKLSPVAYEAAAGKYKSNKMPVNSHSVGSNFTTPPSFVTLTSELVSPSQPTNDKTSLVDANPTATGLPSMQSPSNSKNKQRTDVRWSPPHNNIESDNNNDDDDDDDDDDEEEEELQKSSSWEDDAETTQPDVDRFHHRQKKGFIDVWWLYDDGGLTLLIPYLLTTKKLWCNCKLRVFTAGSKDRDNEQDQKRIEMLLHQFRIECASAIVLPDINKRPHADKVKEFEASIKDWMLKEGETAETHPWKITDTEYEKYKDKSLRHIRLREMLLEHSARSALVVMTLPVPRKGAVSAGLYMAWLDTLSRDMPPTLLLRGNQENVLTYYS